MKTRLEKRLDLIMVCIVEAVLPETLPPPVASWCLNRNLFTTTMSSLLPPAIIHPNHSIVPSGRNRNQYASCDNSEIAKYILLLNDAADFQESCERGIQRLSKGLDAFRSHFFARDIAGLVSQVVAFVARSDRTCGLDPAWADDLVFQTRWRVAVQADAKFYFDHSCRNLEGRQMPDEIKWREFLDIGTLS